MTSKLPEIGDEITGEISDLAFGGKGVLRHEGLVVFVPFVIPGEKVRVKITKVKKRFAEGELLSVEEPSNERVDAPCPYYTQCGGCQLQHMSCQAQAKYKESSAFSTLEKLSGVKLNCETLLHSAVTKHDYRRFIRLNFVLSPGKVSWGYYGLDNRSLIPVKSCHLFHQGEELYEKVERLLEHFKVEQRTEGLLSLFKQEKGKVVASLSFRGQFPKFEESFLLDCFPGVLLRNKARQIPFGDLALSFDAGDLTIHCSTEAFVQNHPEQSALLYKRLVHKVPKPSKVLDLYSGVGATSLLLAQAGCHVKGVELSREAVGFAKGNFESNGLFNVDFHLGKVEEVLPGLLGQGTPDVVIMNPPRDGVAEEALRALCESKPPVILYVSCMPSTLARDLKMLSENYEVSSCEFFDMFPQTSHVETLLELKLKG